MFQKQNFKKELFINLKKYKLQNLILKEGFFKLKLAFHLINLLIIFKKNIVPLNPGNAHFVTYGTFSVQFHKQYSKLYNLTT